LKKRILIIQKDKKKIAIKGISIKIKIKKLFWLKGGNERKINLTKRQKTINQNNKDQNWDKK